MARTYIRISIWRNLQCTSLIKRSTIRNVEFTVHCSVWDPLPISYDNRRPLHISNLSWLCLKWTVSLTQIQMRSQNEKTLQSSSEVVRAISLSVLERGSRSRESVRGMVPHWMNQGWTRTSRHRTQESASLSGFGRNRLEEKLSKVRTVLSTSTLFNLYPGTAPYRLYASRFSDYVHWRRRRICSRTPS